MSAWLRCPSFFAQDEHHPIALRLLPLNGKISPDDFLMKRCTGIPTPAQQHIAQTQFRDLALESLDRQVLLLHFGCHILRRGFRIQRPQ